MKARRRIGANDITNSRCARFADFTGVVHALGSRSFDLAVCPQ